MNQILLLTGIVIVICILSGRLIDKLGVPSLLAFILLGMCFGVDGIFKISFDDYQFSDPQGCSAFNSRCFIYSRDHRTVYSSGVKTSSS